MGVALAAQGAYDKFESIDDDYIITADDVGDAADAQEYIGKTWGELKQQALGNPIISLFSKLGDFAKNLGEVIYATAYATFASIVVYKNPITALKEDIAQFFKFAGAGITIAAGLAIAWKIGLLVVSFLYAKKLIKKQ